MLQDQEILETLKSVGLNLYERKLYLGLLARGVSNVGELSEVAKVPRSRCYDVLETLADKGFVMIKPTKPITYVAVHPEEALDKVKKHHERNFERMRNRVDRVKKTDNLEKLKQLYTQGVETLDPSELTGTIKGKELINQQLASMLKNANSRINLLTSRQGLSELEAGHINLIEKANKKGVKVRILAPLEEGSGKKLTHYAELKDIKSAESIGNLGGRLAIADGNELLFALTHDEKTHPTQDIAMWSKSDHASKEVFEPIFEMLWNEAKRP